MRWVIIEDRSDKYCKPQSLMKEPLGKPKDIQRDKNKDMREDFSFWHHSKSEE